MITRLRQTTTSPFVRAVAVLSGGQSIAIAVPILAAPILGRIYAPADYGALAQYMAPAALLAVLASLQFQHAIIAERTDRGAGRVAWLVFLSSLIMAGLTGVVVTVLWGPFLSRTAAGLWFVALPFSVAGAGVIASGQFLANRHRHYRFLASVQIANVLVTVALSITLGFQSWGASGLLGAYFLGQLVQLFSYLWLLSRLDATLLPRPTVFQLKAAVRRHRKFPAFTLPSEFCSQLIMQIPIFAFTSIGADATLGAFTRARQLVAMPVAVVGNSVSQVFRREASEIYRETGSCRGLMLRTSGWLLIVGLGPCLLFVVFAPWLFVVYLGPAWLEAGEIARILAPMLLLRVMVSPLTTVFYFTGHQALDLKLMLASASVMTLATGLGWALGGTALAIVWAFSVGYGLVYVVYMIATFKVGGS